MLYQSGNSYRVKTCDRRILIRRPRAESAGQAGATACYDCVAGKYLATEGNDAETDCMLCARGTYSYSVGVSVCLECVSGKYADTEGNDQEHADNAVILSSRGNQGCTNLDCPRLGLMAALLLMTIQWV